MNKDIVTLLKKHFDIAFASPEGVTRLRELILSLAMQGKLVRQNPEDQPASELLKEIKAEKKRLIAEKKIRKQKPLPPVSKEEMPYEIPKGWEWAKLGVVADVIRGVTYSKGQANNRIFDEAIELLRANNIDGTINYDQTIHIPNSLVKDEQILTYGDILIAMSSGSPHLVGKAAQFLESRKCTFGAFCAALRAYSDNIFDYLSTFCSTPLYRTQTQKKGKGIGIQNLNKSSLLNLYLPLPPLAEQKRIVSKIDELMAHCDTLETLHKQHREKCLKVHAATIHQLLNQPESKALDFIRQHFSELYSLPENLAELRKAILQLAVMGRLVPQNPDDPPASELLKEIQEEKERLIAEGKIRKQKPLPPVSKEEMPYEIPESWEWVRLGDLAIIERGSSPRPIKAFLTDSPDGLNWIKIGDTDIGGKYISKTAEKIIPEGLSKTREVYPGDFLLTNSMSFGRPYITKIKGCIHDGWLRIAPLSQLDKEFLYQILSSDFIKKQFTKAAAGAVVLNLNSDKVRETHIPLPPLPEQKRIVTRIDQLMKLCDQLDKEITARNNKQKKLLNALMGQV